MRLLDADDPAVIESVGRSLRGWYWRGFRTGALVTLILVIVTGLVVLTLGGLS